MNTKVISGTTRREYIKYALRVRGTSLAQIARELHVSSPTLSQVCRGCRNSDRVRRAIAAKLDRQPEDIWNEPPLGGAA